MLPPVDRSVIGQHSSNTVAQVSLRDTDSTVVNRPEGSFIPGEERGGQHVETLPQIGGWAAQ